MACVRRDCRPGARQGLLEHPKYLYSIDLTGWGWIQLLLGILAAVAGFGVIKGQTWARMVGIGFACLSMVLQFMIIPHSRSGRS